MRLKNIGEIESRGGLLSPFFVVGGSAVCEFPTSSISSLVCNFCVIIMSTCFLLKSFEVVYIIGSTYAHRLSPHKN